MSRAERPGDDDEEPFSVWLVTTSFEHRGSSVYTLGLARRLVDFGITPVIVCAAASKIPSSLRAQFDVIEAPLLSSRFLWRAAVHRLVNEYAEAPPSLIHVQVRALAAIGLELAHRFRRPYILTVQERLLEEETLSVSLEWLGAIAAVSPTVQRDLVLGAHVPERLVHMIPTGVEISDMPVLPALRNDNRVPVVGAASVFEPVKGLMYFLMAAEIILSAGHDVEFVVAGDGPDEEALRRAARALDIANRVTFIEPPETYTAVLDVFDVFVMPSLEQGLGTVMLEAMALGKPVVATRVGGIADFIVDSEHALLVPAANHIVLADKIGYLLDNPEKARALAVGGQQLVRQQFSADRMAERIVELYQQVLEDFALVAP